MDEFKKLGLSMQSIQALEKKGFTTPTEIQSKVIPLLLEGKLDVVGQSQTGTGKTAGFALPILEKINDHSKSVKAIIITPTRELALQVAGEIDSLKGDKDIRVLAVYGGAPMDNQKRYLKSGMDIVVGTPGRVMDMIKRKFLKLEDIEFVVLDEADEMLNMGFIEDIEFILKNTPEEKSMLLFSATMPKQILKIAERYMKKYELIQVEKAQVITKTVEQIYYDINARDRLEGLRRILDFNMDFHGIVFCNTRAAVDTLTSQLARLNYQSAALHGEITQNQREKILQLFRNGQVKVLVATDVAARGIDVNDLTHVINYSLPQSAEAYVHRIGRTGRAGKKGMAITFVMPSERRKLKLVERVNKCTLIRQSLPDVEQIVVNKKNQITTVIHNVIEANIGKSSFYSEMAEQLLTNHKPEDIIAAILKYSFKDQLGPNSYQEISEPKSVKGSDSEFGGRSRQRSSRGRDGGRSRRSNSDNSSGGRDRSRRSRDRRPSRDSEGGERSFNRSRDRKPSRDSEGGERSFNRSRDRKPSRDSEGGERSFKKSYGNKYPRGSEGGERSFKKSNDHNSSRDSDQKVNYSKKTAGYKPHIKADLKFGKSGYKKKRRR